jgi:hypothetical protein
VEETEAQQTPQYTRNMCPKGTCIHVGLVDHDESEGGREGGRDEGREEVRKGIIGASQ